MTYLRNVGADDGVYGPNGANGANRTQQTRGVSEITDALSGTGSSDANSQPWTEYEYYFNRYIGMTIKQRVDIIKKTEQSVKDKLNTLDDTLETAFDDIDAELEVSSLQNWIDQYITDRNTSNETLMNVMKKFDDPSQIFNERVETVMKKYGELFGKISPAVVDLKGVCSSFELGLDSKYSGSNDSDREEVVQLVFDKLGCTDFQSYLENGIKEIAQLSDPAEKEQALRDLFANVDKAIKDVYTEPINNCKTTSEELAENERNEYNKGEFYLDLSQYLGVSAEDAYYQFPQNIYWNLVQEIKEFINPTGMKNPSMNQNADSGYKKCVMTDGNGNTAVYSVKFDKDGNIVDAKTSNGRQVNNPQTLRFVEK